MSPCFTPFVLPGPIKRAPRPSNLRSTSWRARIRGRSPEFLSALKIWSAPKICPPFRDHSSTRILAVVSMISWSSACAPPAPSSLARPMCPSSAIAASATIPCLKQPVIPGISSAPRADQALVLARPWRPAWGRLPSAAMAAAQCAFRHRSAVWLASRRRWAACRSGLAQKTRPCQASQAGRASNALARSAAPLPTAHSCSPSYPALICATDARCPRPISIGWNASRAI